ncbi:Telomerase Cajal body protein 1 [Linnemannia schmuckeri]|uniref:Telomerase Cajal body protein 1 n=1 Tax=Linnemannia schmuckeri TaxID=64567 RepID=A0A9P5V9V2_9FUNG|nr:Telomerase Cajal body protein 1 [Linnemannia schmuckeri]
MDIDSTQSHVMDQPMDDIPADATIKGQDAFCRTHDQHQDLRAQPDQEAQVAAASQDAWQSQTFQVYECSFDNTSSGSGNSGIVKTFSTGNLFNTTVGESRTQMGIQGDNLKMTNGNENNFFKALKCHNVFMLTLRTKLLNLFLIREHRSDLTDEPKDTQLSPGVLIREGEVIYDMCWYPGMTSADPATCCVLSSSRDHPVHLWDAFTGELRCSYTLVDHCEVNFAPNAFCFNLDGSKYAFITRHDISYLTMTIRANGRHNKPSPVVTANDDKTTPSKNGNGATSSPMGGLTQVQFSPDGVYLYSASRQDPFIRCWDIRNTANVLFRLERPGELTNQRLEFDVSSDGRWLSTGDMNGDISIFELSNPTDPDSERLVKRIHGHDDVISSAAFHPMGLMLATSSGQRKYELFGIDNTTSDSDSDSNSDVESHSKVEQSTTSVQGKDFDPPVIDNSISLWTLPGEYVWYVNGQRWSEPSTQEGVTANGVSEAMTDSTNT